MRLFRRKRIPYPINEYRRYSEIAFSVKLMACFLMLIMVFVSLCLTTQTKPLLFTLVPVFYIVVYIFLIEIHKYAGTPAMFVVNLLYLIRYFVLPILSFYDTRVMYLEDYYSGTLLLLYEELAVAIAFALFLPSFKAKKAMLKERAKNNQNRFRFSKQLYLATFAILCLSALMIVANRSALNDYNFIFAVNKENIGDIGNAELNASSLAAIIIDIARILVPASVSLFFIKRYAQTKNKLNYYFAIVIGLFLSMSIIKGVDRGTVLLQGLAMVFFICYLLPEKRIQTLSTSLIILLIVGIYLISIRMFEEGAGDGISGIIDYIQAYVAGIKNQTIVWETYVKYADSVNLETVFNDIFS